MISKANKPEAIVVHITERAVRRLQEQLTEKRIPSPHCFRVTEEAGECYLCVDAPMPGDVVFEKAGRALLVMDARSARARAGDVIHYDDAESSFCFVLPARDP